MDGGQHIGLMNLVYILRINLYHAVHDLAWVLLGDSKCDDVLSVGGRVWDADFHIGIDV